MSVRALITFAALALSFAGLGCETPPGTPLDAGGTPVPDAGFDAGTPPVPDAGNPDAGPKLRCDRASQTFTADVGLFDRAKADLESASSEAARTARVAAFFEAVLAGGGAPLTSRSGDRVVFVARGAPTGGYSVAGEWNGWKAGAQPLLRIGNSDLYAADLSVPRDGPQPYKLVDGTRFFEDRTARNVVWDGFDHSAPGEFNALVRPDKLPAAEGRVIAWRSVHSTLLDDARDVFVYLPARYDSAECPVLPSIYFHDGNEALTRAPFTVPADATYAAHPEQAAVLIFVALPSQAVRTSQYTFGVSSSTGVQYVAFLRDDLLPALQRTFRVCGTARDRGISGASLGGLISSYAAFELPSTFGYVGSQSGSYWWANSALVARAKADAKVPVRFYLDHGCPDDNCEDNRAFAAELTAKGYELQRIEEPGALHEWRFWQKRLPKLLGYFREGRAGCAAD